MPLFPFSFPSHPSSPLLLFCLFLRLIWVSWVFPVIQRGAGKIWLSVNYGESSIFYQSSCSLSSPVLPRHLSFLSIRRTKPRKHTDGMWKITYFISSSFFVTHLFLTSSSSSTCFSLSDNKEVPLTVKKMRIWGSLPVTYGEMFPERNVRH